MNLPPISLHCGICNFYDDADMSYSPQSHLDSCNECKNKYTELSKESKFPQVFKTVMTWALFYDHILVKKKAVTWSENGTAPSSARLIYEGHFDPMLSYQADVKKAMSTFSPENQKGILAMVADMIPAVK